MGFAIAVVLTMALLGSVLWVMPSPREQRLSKMRQQAMSSGLKVRILEEKHIAKLYPWLKETRAYVTYEQAKSDGSKWPIKKPIVVPLKQESVHELDRQSELYTSIAQGADLAALPPSAEALVFYSACVALLWREDSEQGVETVTHILDACLRLEPEVFES